MCSSELTVFGTVSSLMLWHSVIVCQLLVQAVCQYPDHSQGHLIASHLTVSGGIDSVSEPACQVVPAWC